jgi:tetratricopeptide (TPR) repeat protein
VFDGGTTEGGRPYFVMELVKGAPITEFCDLNHFTPRQRLELFIAVCQAVQHAHQKGIIHRDLKPSNILVAMHDTTPVVKVIDFGIAKALGQDLTDKTLFTGFAQMIGTPLYMSPEQAGQSSLDIDTRSDIYSLGVLLYELLTGTTPLSKDRLKQAAFDEIRRIIREEEPPKPSTRLSDSKDSLASISARRKMEPAKLTRLVRGDLDWIVMKALDKDRSRRYESASGFALDVQRHLADEPVQAGPPSHWYRLNKFVRRNRGPVSAAVVLLLALIAGTIGTTIGLAEAQEQRDAAREQKDVADRERDEARRQEEIARKSLEALYSVAATHNPIEQFFPGQLKGGRTGGDAASAALAKAQQELAVVLAKQPRERARLNVVLGSVLRSRGEWRAAMPLLQDAVNALAGSDAPAQDKANAWYHLGWLQREVGDLRDAERSFRECLKVLPAPVEPQVAADISFQLGWTLGDLAGIAERHSDRTNKLRHEAVEAMQNAEKLYNHPSVVDAQVKSAMCRIAAILIKGDYQKVNLLEAALTLSKLPSGADLAGVIGTLVEGEQARRTGNRTEALARFSTAEQTARRIFGPSHPMRVMVLALIGETQRQAGNRAAGDQLMREVLDIARKTWPHHPRMVEALLELGQSILDGKGDPREALKLVEEAEQIAKRHGDDLAHLLPGLTALRKRIAKLLPAPGK